MAVLVPDWLWASQQQPIAAARPPAVARPSWGDHLCVIHGATPVHPSSCQWSSRGRRHVVAVRPSVRLRVSFVDNTCASPSGCFIYA